MIKLAVVLALGLGLGGCIISFDAGEENAFSCQTNADCISPLVCNITDGAEFGVCGRASASVNNPPVQCTDMDGDGFGEGDCEPDCDDSDPTVYPGALEICDGKDNDCDCLEDRASCALEMIDEVTSCAEDADCAELARQPEASNGMACIEGECRFKCTLTLGVCAGSTSECTTSRDEVTGVVTGEVVPCALSGAYGPSYANTAEEQESCDGLDNNCNGQTDGSSQCTLCDPANPRECSSDQGICSKGIRLCEDNMPGACVDPDTQEPVQEPEEEVCDGLDNNCDGVVDNMPNSSAAGTACPDRCPFGMVLVTDAQQRAYCVDRYEASRPDATASSAGTQETYAESQPGVLPWTGLTIEQAQNACRGSQGSPIRARKRLCLLREVEFACAGADAEAYPYGAAYDGARCNGLDAGVLAAAPTGPTADGADQDFAQCVTSRPTEGIFDLSGNVAEFVVQGNLPRLFGGSFQSGMADLACGTSADGAGQSGAHIGFRCCFDP